MCIKTIYHNTYADGAHDVTERVDSCTPGYMCAHPRVRNVNRQIHRAQGHSGRSSPAALQPSTSAPYYTTTTTDMRPSSPLTPPGSRGSDGDRRRRSSVYFDGNKLVEVRHERSPRRHRDRAAVVVEPAIAPPKRHVPFAPEPPAPLHRTMPIPITMKRASTMPYGMETPPEPTRGRRPIIVEDRAPRLHYASDAVPVGPVEVLEHASSGRRRSTRRDSDLLHPHHNPQHRRRHETSPQGYGSAEDDAERRERRRRRRDARAQAAGMATSVPAIGNTDVYSSSWGSSGYVSSGRSSPVVGASPAVVAVKKELRWEDQQRAIQNSRINGRPKVRRSSTATGVVGMAAAGMQAEVKSILKNSPSPGTSPARGVKPEDGGEEQQLTELYRSVEGMSLAQDGRAWVAEQKDSAAYIDRLRNRFSMPPRRFTAGSGNRRRSEIWYPDEGRYKY